MTIKVIDAMCGAGKTSYSIQYMNENPEEMFIYVTPFLKEIERIQSQTLLNIVEPEIKYGKGKKIEHVRELLDQGQNIIMTHELFSRLDEEMLLSIKSQKYTLIMDEVANVLNTERISKSDIRMLRDSNILEIQDDGQIIWKDLLYRGKFNDLRVLSRGGNLFLHNGLFLFWTMPVDNFKSFKEVFILTYLFDGQIQKYYYDMHNLDYEKHSVVIDENYRYKLVDYNQSHEKKSKIGRLLTVYEDRQSATGRKSSLNTNYLDRNNNPEKALSKRWFDKADDEQINQLKKNLVTFFKSQYPTAPNKMFWTAFKDTAPKLKNPKCKLNIKDDRTKDNFLPFNTRATNEYRDRTATAFILNRFMNPNEKQFFGNRGIEVDEDMLAVSDLIQFLFRGCIRNNEPMVCYIPSSRMRTLLNQWIEN